MSAPDITSIGSGNIPGPSHHPPAALRVGSSHGTSSVRPTAHIARVGSGLVTRQAESSQNPPPPRTPSQGSESDNNEVSTTTTVEESDTEAVHEPNEDNEDHPPTNTTINVQPPPPNFNNAPMRGRRRPHFRRRNRETQNHAGQGVPQQQNEQGQEVQQNGNIAPQVEEIVVPHPAPILAAQIPQVHQVQQLDEQFNEREMRIVKDVVDYLVVPVAKSSINLVLIAWYFIYCPPIGLPWKKFDSTTDIGWWFGFGVVCFLGGKAVIDVCKRADIRVPGLFHAFEIRIAQLLVASMICVVLDTIMNPIGFGLGVLYLKTHDPEEFSHQVEDLRKMNLSDYLHNLPIWFHVNLHFLVVSFSILFCLDLTCTFFRMARRNTAMQEVLLYEIYAYLYPVGYIVSTFFVLNCVAAIIPMAFQSFWYLWIPLMILAFSWIAIILAGVMMYPEIPLRRPMGLPGYMYMEQVTLTQIGIGGSLHGILILLRATYFQLVPGSQIQALHAPGIIIGSVDYFSQILGEKGKEEVSTYPYPFTFELIQTTYFLIFMIRYVKLRMDLESIQERIDILANQID